MKEERDQGYRTAPYTCIDYGPMSVLMCFPTVEMAQREKESHRESIKQVHFDEALDIAKKEGAQAALIIEDVIAGSPEGRVVFVE